MPDSKKEKLDYGELTPGYEFPAATYELCARIIDQYTKAVGMPTDRGRMSEFVPPLAIGAYAMTAMGNAISFPPGTIHASQEFKSYRMVPVGTVITCRTRVERNISRGKMNMLVLVMNVFDQDERKVQSGKATLILPAQDKNAQGY